MIEVDKIYDDLDEFKRVVFQMPTPWLLTYYKRLAVKNNEYHDRIENIINDNLGTVTESVEELADLQVNCFNQLLAVGNVLHYRNVEPACEDV